MFFGDMPLQFIADASFSGGKVRFEPTVLLLRYLQGETDPCVPVPQTSATAFCASVAQSGAEIDHQWWKLELKASYGKEHLLALTFNGIGFWEQFNSTNAEDMALVRAFLDQSTLVLEFDMAPGDTVYEDETQQNSVPKWVAALHVTLATRVPPA